MILPFKKRELKRIIDSSENCWFFPEEDSVQGFLGAGEIFIVGDQPSTSLWEEMHPHRRAFYDVLAAEKAGDCHLTDLYKRRGYARELSRRGIPMDFEIHRKLFLKEVALLRPSTVLALGWDAYNLLSRHVPELRSILIRVWHFGTVRHGKRAEFQARLRKAIREARQR